MDEFISRARELQVAVTCGESDQLESGATDYTLADARQAIIHSRQDIVMVVSLLNDLNRQFRTVRRALIALAVMAFVMLLRS